MIHTLNLIKSISFYEAIVLCDVLSELCKKAGVRFYTNSYGIRKEGVVKVAELYRKKGLIIKICKNDGAKYACIDLRLNPIKLVKANVAVTNTKEHDLENIEEAFKLLMSPIYQACLEKLVYKGVITNKNDLKMCKGRKGDVANITDLSSYQVKRIDYCIDVSTTLSNTYMELIRRGDVPSKFEMKMKVDPKSGKKSKYKDSMYLHTKSKDITINFYNKEKEMCGNNHYTKSEKQEAANILRLEIQCARTKVNNMKARYGFESKTFEQFAFNQLALETIVGYYVAVVGKEDYVTLEVARKLINSSDLFLNADKKNMIKVLELINEKRSIYLAREFYIENKNGSRDAHKNFNRMLRHVRSLYINPVTLPVNWGIESLPNLYDELVKAGALPNQAVVTFGIEEGSWARFPHEPN